MMVLVGRVRAGYGDASQTLERARPHICAATGLLMLRPGTLNVELEHEYNGDPDFIIPAAQVNDIHGLHIERCLVGGLRGVLVRNDFGAPRSGWRNNPLSILEIMSEHSLRREPDLTDGERITAGAHTLSCGAPSAAPI
jgi:hypothetical protein